MGTEQIERHFFKKNYLKNRKSLWNLSYVQLHYLHPSSGFMGALPKACSLPILPAARLGLQFYRSRDRLLTLSSPHPTPSQVAEVLFQTVIGKTYSLSRTQPLNDSAQILGPRPPLPLGQRSHAREGNLRPGSGSLIPLPT